MRARLKPFRDQLLKNLEPRFSEFHFQRKTAKAQFCSKRDWGSVAVMLGFIDHGEVDFDFTGSVGLRIDAVEDLVNATNTVSFVTEKDKRSTCTMGAELGNILQIGQKRWTIRNENDVGSAAEDFFKTVETVGFPYLEKYSNLNQVLEVLSGNEQANWLHCPVHGKRCQSAVALAHVLGNQEKVNQLIAQGRAYLKERNDYGLPRFEMLVENLDRK